MTRFQTLTVASLLLSTTAVSAEVPSVVTDFGPTQGIVARVMDGVGEPTALLTGADTPHDFALRPSHARALSEANLVVWVGHAMSPWLEEPLENLAGSAENIELLETEGWTLLETRDDHGDEHDDHDDHGDEHDDEHDEDHGDAHDDDHGDEHDGDHAAEEGDHHGHDHGPNDPHAWLNPDIAAVWAVNIAEKLGDVDPVNAAAYLANATQFGTEIAALGAEIDQTMAQIAPGTLLLSHDNMQYFEQRFGFEPAGYIAESDAAEPGAARIRDIRDRVAAGEITCILSDIETNPGTLALLLEGGGIGTAVLDVTDAAGAGYIPMMRSISEALAGCAP